MGFLPKLISNFKSFLEFFFDSVLFFNDAERGDVFLDILSGLDFFFNVFLKDEPACGGRYKERPPQIAKKVKNLIRDGVSLMALDINNEDKMVGIRTAATVNRLAF